MVITYSTYKNKFGICLIASTHKGICNILFSGVKKEAIADLQSRWLDATITQQILKAHQQIEKYISGTSSKLNSTLDIYGTDFQIKVWEVLISVPEGNVVTYGDIAKKLGDKNLSRAVGTAVGANPIGYIIPCHRVVKSTGDIGGYRWGVKRKKMMLEGEGAM